PEASIANQGVTVYNSWLILNNIEQPIYVSICDHRNVRAPIRIGLAYLVRKSASVTWEPGWLVTSHAFQPRRGESSRVSFGRGTLSPRNVRRTSKNGAAPR